MIKKIAILIILFFVASCGGTKNIQKIESVKFKLPEDAVKIENTALDPNSKKDQKLIQLKNIYKVNDILIGLSQPFKGELKEGFLKDEKNGFDYDYKKFDLIESHQYKSSIEKINNNDVLITYTYYENIGQYSFKILKTDNTEIIGGTIVFDRQSDYNTATNTMYDLLKSAKFE